MTAPTVERWAYLSPDGVYRYALYRRWAGGAETTSATWVMLNPSTADAEVDDPTIRKVMWFSQAAGFGACEVLNLFALRSPDPKALGRHMDPVGPDNADYLSSALAGAGTIVCAWGSIKDGRARGRDLRASAKAIGRELHCLGLTNDGYPRHPRFVPAYTKLTVWT